MMRIASLHLSLFVLVCVFVSIHAFRLYGPYESYPSYSKWHRVTKSLYDGMDGLAPLPNQDKEYLLKIFHILDRAGRK